VNIKSRSAAEGRAAAAYAKAHGYEPASIAFSGHETPMAAIREAWPGVRTMSPQRLKSCFIRYGLVGWSRYVPEACRDAIIYLPINYTWIAWGWPNGFVERMAKANSEVFVVGTFERGADLPGIPELEDHRILPPDYAGGILTDRIEEVGPKVRGRR
jgi:glycerophosphoryl diester phosphodiesterase